MKTLFPPAVHKSAWISPCQRYRYRLQRMWGPGLPVVWIMLNPSKADASQDDPTIKKCMAFARRWGAGGIVVVNLFAYRETDPVLLKGMRDNIVGPDNDAHILSETHGRRIIAAWGCDGTLYNRDRHVMQLLAGRKVECLKLTKDGHPWHPLYVKGDTVPRILSPDLSPDRRCV
jgi:hypothetical protein